MKVKDLYKIDMLAFDSKIGYITNLGTTLYEMQSQYPVGSKEYEEINNRLKLCCTGQSAVIDAAKGIKMRPFPKHWTKYQHIDDNDSEEEKTRKEFENKLLIEKRPEFMKHLYSRYNVQYKQFKNDFDSYCFIKFGCKVDGLSEQQKLLPEVKEMLEYYNKKNPLLETNGVMNKVCRYMENQLKGISKSVKDCDNGELFEKLFNKDIPIDDSLLQLMIEKYNEYTNFKKTKQLKQSEFSTYEQYFKYLRNDCLEKISSNIQELANLAVYVCYQLYPNKPKDFCWDLFGVGIVENLKQKHDTVRVPQMCEDGEIEYLGNRFSFIELPLRKSEDTESFEEFPELEDIGEPNFDDFSDFEGFEDLE